MLWETPRFQPWHNRAHVLAVPLPQTSLPRAQRLLPTGFTTRSRARCVVHTDSIPNGSPYSHASGLKSLFSREFNNLSSPPLCRGAQTLGLDRFIFFSLLLVGKSQDFCAHAWFPSPPPVWSRAVWGSRASRSAPARCHHCSGCPHAITHHRAGGPPATIPRLGQIH